MKQPHDMILYLPGLGGRWNTMRRFLLLFWRFHGVRVHLVPMNWHTNEPLATKLQRVERAIESAYSKGLRVSLVGESAGGSTALSAYIRHADQIHRVVTVCGLNNPGAHISPVTSRANPALQASLNMLGQLLPALTSTLSARIVTVHPKYDPTVHVADTRVPGAADKLVNGTGHMRVIAACLTVKSQLIINLLTKNG